MLGYRGSRDFQSKSLSSAHSKDNIMFEQVRKTGESAQESPINRNRRKLQPANSVTKQQGVRAKTAATTQNVVFDQQKR